MRTAIIIHNCDNDSLLNFTQTKLFFGPKSEGRELIGDCIIVNSWAEAYKIAKGNDIVLETGDYLTATYLGYHIEDTGVRNVQWCEQTEGHEQCIIKFDKDIPITFKKRYYKPGSKQLYIIENVLKGVLSSKKLIYLENTEDIEINPIFYRVYPGPGRAYDYTKKMKTTKHFYGLASGFKSMVHAVKNNYESVTIFDRNERQLNFNKMLHGYEKLPVKMKPLNPVVGVWNPSDFIKDNWSKWHNMDVKFELMDLFDIPRFKPNSMIWCSNAFHYEPTIFLHGYQYSKNKLKELTEANPDCIIITDT